MKTSNKTRSALALIALLTASAALAAPQQIVMVKNQGCVCCERWAAAAQKAGFGVKTVEMADVTPYKDKVGVPPALRSCHTAKIGGYLFEGHVPADLIAKVVREKPAIAGLAAPGMPAAAPGMDIAGAKAPYQIIAFDHQGHTSVYATR